MAKWGIRFEALGGWDYSSEARIPQPKRNAMNAAQVAQVAQVPSGGVPALKMAVGPREEFGQRKHRQQIIAGLVAQPLQRAGALPAAIDDH